MDISYSVYLPAEHLGCCYFLALMKYLATINIWIQVFIKLYAFIFFRYIPMSGVAEL